MNESATMIPARLRPLSRTTGAAALRSPRRAPLVPGLFSLALALALVSCGGDRGASNPSANGGASKRGAPIELSRGTSLDLHPAFAPDGRSLAFCSDRNGRSEIWLRSLDDGSERAITNDSQDNYTPAFRPDGGLIAYSSKERRGIWVIPPEGGEPRRLTEFGSRPVFSPDGKTIVFQSEGVVEQSSTSVSAMPPSTLWSVTSDGGVPTPLTTAGSPPGGHGSPAFSPDGRFIAFVANDPQSAEIWIIPAAGGAPLPFVRHEKFNYDPVFSPDGKMLYFCIASKDFTYWIGRVPFDSSTGAPSGSAGPIASIPQGAVKHVAISPDGKRLAYSIVWTQSNLWSVPLDSKTSEPSGPPRAITNDKARNTTPRFSGDGAELAFVRWLAGRNPGDLWMMKADGSELRRLTSHPDFETQPTWRSDRSAVSFVSNRGGKLALYQVDVENGLEELLSDVDPEMDRVFVSPDGTRLVWHSKRGTGIMNVWTMDLADKKPRQLTFDKEMMGFPCWSPDGKWIAIEVKRGEDDHVGVLPSTGGPVALLTSGAGRNWPHSFSPDGDKVTVSAMRNGVWDVRWISRKTKEERPVILPVKRSAFVRYPEWSPRGDQIVYEYGETTGRIWLAAVPN